MLERQRLHSLCWDGHRTRGHTMPMLWINTICCGNLPASQQLAVEPGGIVSPLLPTAGLLITLPSQGTATLALFLGVSAAHRKRKPEVPRCDERGNKGTPVGGTSAIKKGRGEKARGDCLGTEYSDSRRSFEHVSPRPPWPRILEHVYKKAMREVPIAPVR